MSNHNQFLNLDMSAKIRIEHFSYLFLNSYRIRDVFHNDGVIAHSDGDFVIIRISFSQFVANINQHH